MTTKQNTTSAAPATTGATFIRVTTRVQDVAVIAALPAPRVIGSKNIGPNNITLRRAAELRADRIKWEKGDGYWANQSARELSDNPGYYRVEVGGLGRANEREPGVIYRRPATSGKWGKSAATRLGAPLMPAITLSTHMATYVDLAGHDITHPAPKGMLFFADDNGVYLRRVTDGMDYHPTAADWTAKDFATVVRRNMAQNFQRRRAQRQAERQAAKDKKEQARIDTIYQRQIPSVRVTLEDSRRAGNCVEGSLQFAERKLRLSREQVVNGGYMFSVPASKLRAAANGDKPAVERAIKAAWMRETTVSI